MARLTRTQKYAELRERMAHDSETSFITPDLGKYEEKLTQLDNLFKETNLKSKEEKSTIDFDALGLLGNIELKKSEVEEPKVVEEKVVEEDSIEKISQDKMEKVLSIEQMVENMVSEVENEIRKIAPVEAKPTFTLATETPVQNIPNVVEEKVEDVETAIDNLIHDEQEDIVVQDENVKEAVDVLLENAITVEPVVEEKEEETTPVEEEKPAPVVEEVHEDVVINAPSFSNEFDDIAYRTEQMISLMDPSMTPDEVKEEPTVIEDVEVKNEEPVIIEEPTLEIASEDLKDIDELLNSNLKDIDDLLNEELLEIKDNLVEDVVEEPVVIEERIEPIEIKAPVIDVPDILIDNSFVNEALEEVKEYNLDKGNETLDTLPNSIIDQVRHTDLEIPSEDDEDDDGNGDVSNTISLELDKVLSSMEEPEIDVDDLIVDEPVNEEVATKVVDIAELEEPQEEHKAIAQTLEEDVVEIKSLNETLKLQSSQVVTNVLDDTVPFDISGEEYDDDDDDVPSKTLNIILGVLITVLVLVLCVIIYYILVARGILG